MPTPASDQDEPSKMKKLMSGNVDESIRDKLPQGNGSTVQRRSIPSSYTAPPVASPEPAPRRWPFRFLPAFWTIASLMSITVNIVLLVIILILFQMLGSIQNTANDQFSGLLGGLYTNFVKMDQATISSTIPVDAVVPLNITVPVKATTQITLAQNVTIPNAHVRIITGAINIDANATVTLPAGQPLMVNLDFPLNVQDNIPIHLDVPVNIPLNQTQLHEPFVGLQKVVEPWYCIVEPGATVNGLQVCSPAASPTLFSPTPAETVIP
jgi:hypothetical protein